MWKFQDFSVTPILREINFAEFRSKIAVFAVLGAGLSLQCRPLVDTFKMYLCADTATFCQMYLCTDTIQYQYISKVSDTDTFSIIFGPNFSFYCIFFVTIFVEIQKSQS